MRTAPIYAKMQQLELGDYVYIETELQDYRVLMSLVTATTRYPVKLQGRKFSCRLFAGVHVPTDVRTLVRIERFN